jgi:hypothetical protein
VGTGPQSLVAKPRVEFYNWLARSGESPTVCWNWSHKMVVEPTSYLLAVAAAGPRLGRALRDRKMAPHRRGGERQHGRASSRPASADAGLWNDSSLGCIILAGSGSAGEYHVGNFFGMVRRGRRANFAPVFVSDHSQRNATIGSTFVARRAGR